MINIKISVIVPCYNQSEYLSEALNSVLNQTYKNWECIIVNDGSIDNTENIAEEWILKDERIKYVFQKNRGLSSARNLGIEMAIGEWILPLDADDKIEVNYLELAIKTINSNNHLKVVYSNAIKFGEVNENWELKPFNLHNLARENMIFCSAFFKKKDWKAIGGYDINMKYGYEDWEFWIHMLKNGGNVVQLKQKCFFYRVRKKSMVRSINNNKMNYLFDYLSVKHTDFFVKNLGSFSKLYFEIKDNEKKIISLKLSKKMAINILVKSIFGVNIFKLNDGKLNF